MKHLATLVSLLLWLQQGFAQRQAPEYATPFDFPNRLKNVSPAVMDRLQAGMTSLKVYMNICRNNNGTAQPMTEAQVREELRIADSVYRLGNICLSIVGVDVLDNSTLNNSSTATAIRNSGTLVPHCLNVYIVSNLGTGIFGTAFAIPNNFIAVVPAGFGQRRTFIHEFGHDLGPFHTHHGQPSESTQTTCAKLVNGSNALDCGDFVAGTPADPYDNFAPCNSVTGTKGTWNGTCKDPNNQPYAPNTHNYMSYRPNANAATCLRNVFSAGRFQRMQMTLAEEQLLLDCVVLSTKRLAETSVTGGKIVEMAKETLTVAGTAGPAYSLTDNVQATLASPRIFLRPGFAARPSATGHVLIQSSVSVCH